MRKLIKVMTIVGMLALVGGLGASTTTMSILNATNTSNLELKYSNLLDDFKDLNDTYYLLSGNYIELDNNYTNLQDNYDALLADYNALTLAYGLLCDTIKNSILPVQYCIFAEAVRRYYMPLYLANLTGKELYKGYAAFCRDMILHDTWQYNAFTEVSNAFSEALKYGNDTMLLAYGVMFAVFFSKIPNWNGKFLSGNDLTDINTIVDWCITELDYEYDSDITDFQENPTWDYPKFPVETAFRTMGDCEDQAVLCAAYLESCGFETVMSIFHDPNHPTIGSFYHGVLLVHIEDTNAFYDAHPSGYLWRLDPIDPYFPHSTWCYVDPTWDTPFGSIPSWLQAYIDADGVSFAFQSIAFCEPQGMVV